MSTRRKDRWYSIEGQRRIHRSALESSKGPRQLLSLVVLLSLTLIAMNQVSDPKRVGRVAAAVGLLPSTQDPSSALPTNDSVPDSLLGQPSQAEDREMVSWTLLSSNPNVELAAQILAKLLRTAPPGLASQLGQQFLIDPDTGLPSKDGDEKKQRELTEWLSAAKDQLNRWSESTDSMSSEHAVLIALWEFLDRFSESESREDGEWLIALELALERTLLKQFADNTPWRSSERNALIRSTLRAVMLGEAFAQGRLVPEILPAIAVPQLMGDTPALRGRAVRISGSVALMDQPASLSIEDPRVNHYGVLWLRPDDGSNQPIIIHVPKSLNIPIDQLKKEDPIIVSGIVTKRRAYASNRGGDIAPVLIAAHIQSFAASDRANPVRLTDEQKRIAQRWQAPRGVAMWIPPADFTGARQRIEQRIGARAQELKSHLEPFSFDEPESPDTLTHDPLVQTTLASLNQVTDDLRLIARADWKMLDTSAMQLKMIRGWITQVRAIPIEKEPFPGWQWKELYACTLQPFSDEQPSPQWLILTQHVPASWLEGTTLRQPAVAVGLAYDSKRSSSSKVLISPSVQWRHEEGDVATSLSPQLPLGWKSLLDRGWNLNWIDTLEGLQGKPMTARESEAFYNLLRCSEQPLDAADNQAGQVLSIMETIQRAESRKTKRNNEPKNTYSSGYRAAGVVHVRRVQRIDVSDPEGQQWLGGDHYYQLDGFADIGNSRITVRYDETDEPIVFEKEFPITLVAVQVPNELLVDAADAIPGEAQAWYPRTRIAVDGWFYRMWRFKTTQVSEATNDKESQMGPMLVVDRFETAPARTVSGASNWSPTAISAITTTVGILGGLWIFWRIRQGVRRPRARI